MVRLGSEGSQSRCACQASILRASILRASAGRKSYFCLGYRKRCLISCQCSFKRCKVKATHRSCFDHAVELDSAADRQVLQRSFKGVNAFLVVSLSFLIYIASFYILQV
jgi:hypothetical protein